MFGANYRKNGRLPDNWFSLPAGVSLCHGKRSTENAKIRYLISCAKKTLNLYDGENKISNYK